jgi:hypothetical protein
MTTADGSHSHTSSFLSTRTPSSERTRSTRSATPRSVATESASARSENGAKNAMPCPPFVMASRMACEAIAAKNTSHSGSTRAATRIAKHDPHHERGKHRRERQRVRDAAVTEDERRVQPMG